MSGVEWRGWGGGGWGGDEVGVAVVVSVQRVSGGGLCARTGRQCCTVVL